jgi:hypothetical protein
MADQVILPLDQFRAALAAGELAHVSVTAAGDHFLITAGAAPRGPSRTILAGADGTTPHIFAHAHDAITILHHLNIHHAELDTASWKTGAQPSIDPEYEAWFRAEITQALVEADDPATIWIDHEEVVRQSRARRPAGPS